MLNNVIVCDGINCTSKVHLPDDARFDTYIPDYWIRYRGRSLAFVWEVQTYDLCSIACYKSVVQAIDEILNDMVETTVPEES